MLAGVYGSRKGILTPEVGRGLTNILLEIALPCMVITSFTFSYNDNIKSNVVKAFYYSLAVYIIMTAVSYILLHPIKDERKTILHFANVFVNTGYIGFPVLNAVYGAEAVIYGSIFNMFFVIFLWTYGVMIFKGKIENKVLGKEIIKALLNPSLIAVYFGIAMMIFDIKLPVVITKSINAVGGITGPLSMMLVGAMASKINIKDHITDWTLYYGIAAKTVMIPAVLYLISLVINDRSMVSNSIIIIASMPAAAMTSILADSYNVKRDYAAVVVVATTLVSIFTLPLLLRIISGS
jgi:predicted permease